MDWMGEWAGFVVHGKMLSYGGSEHHDIREALLQALPGDAPEGYRRTVSASCVTIYLA